MTSFWFDWQWDAAERDFRSAGELNPSNPAARMFLAHLHSNLARHDAAIAEIRAGQCLDPIAPIMHTHEAHFLYNASRYDEAAAPLKRALDLAPRFWVAHIVAGKFYGMRGRLSDAIDAFSKAHRFSHGNTEAVGLRGYTLGASGNAADARRVLRELQARARRRYVPPVHQALVHLGLGDRQSVFDALEQAIDERDVRLTFLAIEPRRAPLLNSPRFEKIRARVGLPRIAASKAWESWNSVKNYTQISY